MNGQNVQSEFPICQEMAIISRGVCLSLNIGYEWAKCILFQNVHSEFPISQEMAILAVS
jgi:hypothetical protein